jgi:hypothetical protein
MSDAPKWPPGDPRSDPRVSWINGDPIGPPDVMREVARVERAEMEAALAQARAEAQTALSSEKGEDDTDEDVSDLNDYDDL